MTDPAFVPALPVAGVPVDGMVPVTIAGRAIPIVHHGGALHAVDNRCSHADQPLDCGRVRWGWIACPAHGAKFDLETGAALSSPAVDPIAVFPLRVADGMIEVAV